MKSRLGLAHRPSVEDEPEATTAELERREWGAVVAARMRAQLLEVAARDGAEAVAAFVADLLDQGGAGFGDAADRSNGREGLADP